jgi:hypothetical protein
LPVASNTRAVAPVREPASSVVGTSNGAVQRVYRAVVPVDGMSAEDSYNEQYAAWHLYKGGPVNLTEKVTLTRSDLIKFAN